MQKKLNKRQINLAAKIYSLAVIFHADPDSRNINEDEVLNKATKNAEEKFFKMFPNEVIPVTLTECIELAKRIRIE